MVGTLVRYGRYIEEGGRAPASAFNCNMPQIAAMRSQVARYVNQRGPISSMVLLQAGVRVVEHVR